MLARLVCLYAGLGLVFLHLDVASCIWQCGNVARLALS